MNGNDPSHPTWRRRLTLAVLFAAGWAVPRLPAIRADVVMRDDLVHLPFGHLTSYRPLFFADLWLWRHVFGPDYLQTIFPKLLGGTWAVLLAILTTGILRRRSDSAVLSTAIPLLFLSHPIVNELTLFNSVAPVTLSMLLAVAAFVVLDEQVTLLRAVTATLLLAASISGYQINLTVFVILVVFAATVDMLNGTPPSAKALAVRAAIAGSASLLYMIYVVASTELLGIRSWGGRGFMAQENGRLFETAGAKWHGATNMLADITQPTLSWFLWAEAAWQMWAMPFAFVGLLFIAGVARRRQITVTILAGLGFMLLLLVPPSILIFMNVTPEGWRVCGPALYAFTLQVALMALAWKSITTSARVTATATMVVLIGASMFLAQSDARLRADAARRDKATLQFIGSRPVEGFRGSSPGVCVFPPSATAIERMSVRPDERQFLMAEFHRVTWLDYSNLWTAWSFPDAYLRANGIEGFCPDQTAAEKCGALPLRRKILFDDKSNRVYLCR